MIWLLDHQTESENVYEEKLSQINLLCNEIYNSMHKLKLLETVKIINDIDSDSGSDTEHHANTTSNTTSNPTSNTTSNPPGQKIKEDINAIINSLPSKPTKRHMKKSSDGVYLKLDINKLSKNRTIKFKDSINMI